MSLENVINQIFRENTNYFTAQQALNQARSLKSLSNDLYTDPLRFVYELVQNCDDACQPKSILRIAILDHQYLIVAHNGKPFSENDVRGLCDVGCSTKGEDSQKTGYKGLGFKAVFGRSDYVLVLSNGEYFRFDAKAKVFNWNVKWGVNQQNWEQKNKRTFEYPWQICPIWTNTNEVPENIRKWFFGQTDAVATIIRLKNISETRDAIGQLTEQPHVFMFLRNIRTVRFSINSPQEILLNVNTLRDGSLQILIDWKQMSHWLLHSCTVDVPDDVHDDIRLPEKLQQAKSTELMLAARIDKNDTIESVQGRHNGLFAYLPTKIIVYNFPVLVNANFLTNASREHIHTDSLWNQFLFSCIPYEMIKWIGQLRKQDKWAEKALHLLPTPLSMKDALAEKYNDNCPRAAEEGAFLLNFEKKLLKISEAVIDVTGFSRPNCLGNDLIRSFILRTYSPRPSIALNPFVSNSARVRKFKILIFDWPECINMFKSEEFLTKLDVEQAKQFLNYLFEESEKQPQIQPRLKQLPFLMDRKGNLRMTNEIYLSSQFNNTDWSIENDSDPYVHDDIVVWLGNNPPVLKWLKSLGVTEKTDEIFVRQRIIPAVRHYITPNNALSTIRKLFDGFHHRQIRMDLFQQLNKLKLISVEGTLVPADELYFSDSYHPRLALTHSGLPSSNFLSPNYLKQKGANPDMMKQFFLLLGVQEDIKLIRFTNEQDQRNEVISTYRFQQTQNLFQYNSLQFQRCLILPFLDFTQQNYNFAVFFWQHVIFSINVNELLESEVLICDQQQFRQIDNLPFWFVRTRPCIPTTTKGQLLKSTEVFSSDLRSIAGDFLPVFACTTQTPFPHSWQHFFQFKTSLSIQDHIQLLNLLYDRLKNTPLNDDNESNIQRIYSSLIHCLTREDIRRNRPKQPFYLLSTIDNSFIPSNNLVVTCSNDFTLPNHIAQLKLSTGNRSNQQLSRLLEFFDIKQITINDLALPSNLNAQPSLSLRAKLRHLQTYLFQQAQTRNLTNHRIDNDLEFFELERLELYYNGTDPVLQKHIHHIDNRIYVTQPWNSKAVMDNLPRLLCQLMKLPISMESDIRQFLLNEQTNSSSIPSPLNLSIDLLNIEGTRSKFAMVIDRDNEQLFNHLKLTDVQIPGEFLLKALDAQKSRFSGYIYHHTHLENAVSILRDRALKSRNHLPVEYFKDCANEQVIQRTRAEVKDYARFYFRTLTPTQYCNENLGLGNSQGNRAMCPVPIIFRIDLKAILAIPDLQWKVSLGNLTNPQTEFDHTMDIVKKFDYQHIYADIRTERGKCSSEHEFLIKTQLNFDDLPDNHITIICQDANARNSLQQMTTHRYSILINESFYFNSNIQIQMEYDRSKDEMTVFTNAATSSTNQGQLILQLIGKNSNRTIEGNLSRSIQRGDVSTVYSNQQFSFIVDANHLQHAIYYEYAQQIWLIHTNATQPHFIQP